MFTRLVSLWETHRKTAVALSISVVVGAMVLLFHFKEALFWLHDGILELAKQTAAHPVLPWAILGLFIFSVILLLAAGYSLLDERLRVSQKDSQIGGLKGEVQTLEGRLVEVRKDIKRLETENTELQTLKGRLEEARTHVERLETEKVRVLEHRLSREKTVRDTLKRMMMTAYQITQQTSAQHPKKSILCLESTYLISENYDGSIEKVYRLKAVEQLNFYEVNVRVESEAIPQELLDDIDFKVKDGDGKQIPYMPIENDPHRKVVAIFFLPPLEPGTEKTIVVSYTWPGMFNKLKVEGFERGSWNMMKASVSLIDKLSFSFYGDPALGKRLTCEPDGYKGGTQQINTSVHKGTGWPGFAYQITDAPPGTYALRVELRE